MKLELNAAWDQAVRLIALNREVVLVLAGVFLFLPYVLFLLLVPIPEFAAMSGPGGEATPAMTAAINGFIREYWWAILLMSLIQAAGGIALMAVLGDPARPTVGTAMERGGRYLPTSIGAQLVLVFAIVLVFFAAILIGALTRSAALVYALSLMALPVIVWLATRLSLTNTVIAIEREGNPVAALRRSWGLTAGSGLRLVMFYILLLAAFFVISAVVGLLVQLITALLSAQLATIVEALLSSLIYTALVTIGYAVLASVHRQLARAERVSVPGTARAD